MKVINRLLATLAFDEIIHHAGIQGARPIQGQHGNNVFKSIRLKLGQEFFHAIRFHLKNRGGVGIT